MNRSSSSRSETIATPTTSKDTEANACMMPDEVFSRLTPAQRASRQRRSGEARQVQSMVCLLEAGSGIREEAESMRSVSTRYRLALRWASKVIRNAVCRQRSSAARGGESAAALTPSWCTISTRLDAHYSERYDRIDCSPSSMKRVAKALFALGTVLLLYWAPLFAEDLSIPLRSETALYPGGHLRDCVRS